MMSVMRVGAFGERYQAPILRLQVVKGRTSGVKDPLRLAYLKVSDGLALGIFNTHSTVRGTGGNCLSR